MPTDAGPQSGYASPDEFSLEWFEAGDVELGRAVPAIGVEHQPAPVRCDVDVFVGGGVRREVAGLTACDGTRVNLIVAAVCLVLDPSRTA